jgi:mRNA interferase HigB
MRIIAKKALRDYWEAEPDCQDALSAWYAEAKAASWPNSMALKQQYASASIINHERVVFNIKGNHYRLVVRIDYRRQMIFILWVGTHKEYDKINVETIPYEAR